MPNKTRYICGECAHEQAKWLGRCPSCGKFNTLKELIIKPTLPGGAGAAASGNGGAKARRAVSSPSGEYSASDDRRETHG
ncbi:MAG: hypothetical protein FWC08_05450, partial [Defluviitaleaceae bacterium]|nr:hypothetical protein [Defluviitaleaceae bacterium]